MAPPEANNISLDLLRTLVTFSEVGRVEETARHLKLTQAAVSLQLKKLEAELKVPLFQNIGRKKVLTDEARDLVLEITPLFKSIDEVFNRSLRKKREERALVLRVGCRSELMRRILPLIAHKGALKFFSMSDEECTKALREDRIDLAIVQAPSEAPQFKWEKLFQDQVKLILHRSLLTGGGKSLSDISDQLLGLPFVAYGEEAPHLDQLAHFLGYRTGDFNQQFVCEEWKTVLDLTSQVRGWALAPELQLESNTELEVIDLPFIQPTQYYFMHNEHFKAQNYLRS